MTLDTFGLHNTSTAVTDGGTVENTMAQDFKADLRWDDGGRLTDRTISPDRAAAFLAFRALLARTDLEGQAVAARFVVDGRSLYFSRFDKPFGAGRIHPDAPIRADVGATEADQLATVLISEATLRGRAERFKRLERGFTDELLTGVGSPTKAFEALDRLFAQAMSDTGQSRRVAQFLMSCWNATELGAFDPADLFSLDRVIALDIVDVIAFLARQDSAIYFNDLGFGDEIAEVIRLWKRQ